MELEGMKTYYLSLVCPFYGYYLVVVAKDESMVRQWAVETLGTKVWCCVYTQAQLSNQEIDPPTIGQTIYLSKYGDAVAVNYF